MIEGMRIKTRYTLNGIKQAPVYAPLHASYTPDATPRFDTCGFPSPYFPKSARLALAAAQKGKSCDWRAVRIGPRNHFVRCLPPKPGFLISSFLLYPCTLW